MAGIGSGTGPTDWLKILFPTPERPMLSDEQQAVRHAELLVLLDDPEVLDLGRTVYRQHCFVCHHQPSALVYSGADPVHVEWVIRFGDVAEGMPAWQGLLTEPEIDAVTAYVLAAAQGN
ncbi:cytochrome c [Arthrospira platensis SPKY1]|nr:cytochrome c [Arthrospira platensis SPKY1]